ncbi:MAG TPA: hypothetical protein VD862_02600 [Candidatus Paceibacterota bacterium]|nr:hypothetical protein [Candidatus Paceibacterota bacterium]
MPRERAAMVDWDEVRKQDGVYIPDLKFGDELLITVGDGPAQQVLFMGVMDPAERKVFISSRGPWAIWLHVTHFSGSCARYGNSVSSSLLMGWLILGMSPVFGAWNLPAVTRIVLNGTDISARYATLKD